MVVLGAVAVLEAVPVVVVVVVDVGGGGVVVVVVVVGVVVVVIVVVVVVVVECYYYYIYIMVDTPGPTPITGTRARELFSQELLSRSRKTMGPQIVSFVVVTCGLVSSACQMLRTRMSQRPYAR